MADILLDGNRDCRLGLDIAVRLLPRENLRIRFNSCVGQIDYPALNAIMKLYSYGIDFEIKTRDGVPHKYNPSYNMPSRIDMIDLIGIESGKTLHPRDIGEIIVFSKIHGV